MKSFVVTVLDDVVAKNGKDPEATQLIEVARAYGKVEPLENVLAGVKMEYQGVIDNLRAQFDACKQYAVTPMELEILNAIRKKTEIESASYEQTIAKLEQTIVATQTAQQALATRLEEVVEQMKQK